MSSRAQIRRFEEICKVLFEEEFGALLAKTPLIRHIPMGKRIRLKFQIQTKTPQEVRLRRVLERLGGTCIKFGQLLSIRPDLVPKHYIRELEKLQESVPPEPFDAIAKVLIKELGKGWRKKFTSFDSVPIASASISQVYKAVLKNGKKVAVKIQRPNIELIMNQDIDIMRRIAVMLEKHIPGLQQYKLVGVVEEFRRWTEKELDFEKEAANAQRFAKNFKDDPGIKIPEIYDYLSTSHVLTLEYLDGIHLHNLSKNNVKKSVDPRVIIEKGFDAVMTQVFIHGFFHADPHPGNFIILKNNVLGIVDFGIVGHFDETLKRVSQDLFLGIITQDTGLIVDSLLKMGLIDDQSVDIYAFRQEVLDAIDPLVSSKARVSHVLDEVLDIALTHKIRIPSQFVLLGKTIITLEGVALEFDPDFDFAKHCKPFIKKIIKDKTNPRYVATSFLKNANRLSRFLEELPDRANRVMDRFSHGHYKVQFENKDINRLSLEIDRSSNRIAIGLVMAALVLAGSLTIGSSPQFRGISLLSWIFFAVVGLLGISLLVSIHRERQLR